MICVGAGDERQPVGDDDDRAAVGDAGQMLLHDGLALGIERTRRLVENQDRRAVDQRTGDRQPLTLPARQVGRTLFEHRRIAVRQALDELVRAGDLGGAHHLVERGGGFGHRDVLAHRAAKQEILLQHDADPGAQIADVELLQILAVDLYQARLRPVETLQQAGDRRLAGAAAADDADDLAGLDRKRDVLDRRGQASRDSER